MSKHTKLPLSKDAGYDRTILDSNGEQYCVIILPLYETANTGKKIASQRTDFIVRTANHYTALLKACKKNYLALFTICENCTTSHKDCKKICATGIALNSSDAAITAAEAECTTS